MPRGTQVPAALFSVSGTRLSLALAGLSRPLPLPTPRSRMPALQPRMNESMRFGLIPVRSPLLGESRLISFPSGTEMFHFPEFAPCNLCIQLQVTGYDSRRVSPFRDPRIKGCLAPPRGLSQLTTSFIAFRRQGIHPMLLSTCLLEKNFLPSLFNCKGAASFKAAKPLLGSKQKPLFLLFSNTPCICGGAGRNRTDDLLRAKQALSQLSYSPIEPEWWAWKDLNFRPHAYQACALTT